MMVSHWRSGTWIATTRGVIEVEFLRPADRVCTVLGGDTTEVVWIGRREVDCARHPDPRAVWPVSIAPHAFGRGMPDTELLLSPDHAIHLDQALIPIGSLVNGRSLRQILTDRVIYRHVELARHDVMLANGMPVESWPDTADRAGVSNGGGVIALYPDFSGGGRASGGCAPLVLGGPVLAAVRRRLASGTQGRGRRRREPLTQGASPGTGLPR